MARLVPGVFGVALGVSLLLPPTPALAHNSLTGSDPRDGARVATAPARIELRFLSRLDPRTTKITVTGPDNVAAAGGAPTFSGSRVRVPFKPGRAGLYIVGYQVASGDGHPVTGEVRFTLTTGTAADPSASPSPTGAASLTASAASPPVTPTAATTGPDGASPTAAVVPAADERDDRTGWLWALAGLVLLAALVTGLLLRRRAGRNHGG
ncbi:copper resistance CopC family protein [Micromonospora sp. WMMD812]|uniref:copper resistance CopC family protein n=1 Tax=Micromonospora sp. WMMD812 TaxID=3015152 RepID=UPI00248CB286|nr:copper resistance CopC family protein [Micromonospora sp. WMMD812]WBB67065.1 copper resistance protein CopC [Micromonospora sp. WMMD812]